MKLFPAFLISFFFAKTLIAQNPAQIKVNGERGHLLSKQTEIVSSTDTNSIQYYNITNLGISKCNNGDYKNAISDFSKAIELKPTLYKAYLNRSMAYSKINKYPEAMKDVNKAIQLDSTKYESVYNRAVLYKDQQLYEPALMDFRKTIVLNPNFAYAYAYLAECDMRMGNSGRGIVNLNKAIMLDSNNAEFYYTRSVYYAAKEEIEMQFQDLKKVLLIDPRFSSALNNIGYYYFNNKQLDSALYYYSEAIKYDKNNLRYRCNRARAYEHNKQYNLAINDLSFAISAHPTEAYFYMRRSELYMLAGQKENAGKDIEKYNELK
jgi:tetratricopeptide (TPR) repeat protein